MPRGRIPTLEHEHPVFSSAPGVPLLLPGSGSPSPSPDVSLLDPPPVLVPLPAPPPLPPVLPLEPPPPSVAPPPEPLDGPSDSPRSGTTASISTFRGKRAG